MLTLSIAVNAILLVAVIVLALHGRDYTPTLTPMCHECGRKFTHINGLLDHYQASHPRTYDQAPRRGVYR